jgi:integrase
MKLISDVVERLKLPPGKSDWIVFDDDLPGFGLRIREGGARTWLVQYRIGTKQRRLKLGTVNKLKPAEARQRARKALAKVDLGHDPQGEKLEAKAQAAETFGCLMELYLPQAGHTRKRPIKPRSRAEIERYLKVVWKPLHEMPVVRVDRKTIAGRLGEIAQSNGPIAANRAQDALSAMFSWAIGAGHVDQNPVLGVPKMGREERRDRVLTDEELKLVWRHAGDDEYGAILRLLILTGQRREEVGSLTWGELDLSKALWSIGPERTKNALRHEVPLSSQALAILETVPIREGRRLLFGASRGGFSSWSKAKQRLDRRWLQALREEHGDGIQEASLVPWRLHDIRRTVATRMADLGVLPHVIEAILNHVSGHKRGVAGTYNRSTYSGEKRTALTLWAEHVAALTGEGSKVVPLKRAG